MKHRSTPTTLLAGAVALLFAFPGIGLGYSSEAKSMIETLRQRVKNKGTEAPQTVSTPEPTPAPVPTPAPLDSAQQKEIDKAPPVVTPPTSASEASTPVEKPIVEEEEPKKEPVKKTRKDRSSKKSEKKDTGKPASTEPSKEGKEGKPSPAPDQKESTNETAREGIPVSAEEKKRARVDRESSDLIKRIMEKLQGMKGSRKHDGKEQPQEPPAPAPAAPAPVVPAPAPAAVTEVPAAPSNGAPRNFGELSDEELIKYAQDHVWSAEKSRKHNPPWTPPYRPKKKAKSKGDETVTKSDSAKGSSTDKAKSGKSTTSAKPEAAKSSGKTSAKSDSGKKPAAKGK